ncbi:MAG: protein kinase, partial [Candidatus Omnitrophica bacterium]|nr:protein kinase [Candidatus Omnitrophota bacterium]
DVFVVDTQSGGIQSESKPPANPASSAGGRVGSEGGSDETNALTQPSILVDSETGRISYNQERGAHLTASLDTARDEKVSLKEISTLMISENPDKPKDISLVAVSGSPTYLLKEDDTPDWSQIGDLDVVEYCEQDASDIVVWSSRTRATQLPINFSICNIDALFKEDIVIDDNRINVGAFRLTNLYFGNYDRLNRILNEVGLEGILDRSVEFYIHMLQRIKQDVDSGKDLQEHAAKMLKRLYELAFMRGKEKDYQWLLETYKTIKEKFDEGLFKSACQRALNGLQDTQNLKENFTERFVGIKAGAVKDAGAVEEMLAGKLPDGIPRIVLREGEYTDLKDYKVFYRPYPTYQTSVHLISWKRRRFVLKKSLTPGSKPLIINEAVTMNRVNPENKIDNLPGMAYFVEFPDEETYGILFEEITDSDRLHEIVRDRKSLEEIEALDIAIKVAEILQRHVHNKGVIHRDIKPQHIYVKKDGQVKLLDFDISAALEYDWAKDPYGIRSRCTPLYAPLDIVQETARPDFSDDAFGLGATLYFMLTGSDLPDTQINHGDTRMTEREIKNPDILRIILKATNFERKERYHDIGEMLADLRECKSKLEHEGARAGAMEDTKDKRRRMKPEDAGAVNEVSGVPHIDQPMDDTCELDPQIQNMLPIAQEAGPAIETNMRKGRNVLIVDWSVFKDSESELKKDKWPNKLGVGTGSRFFVECTETSKVDSIIRKIKSVLSNRKKFPETVKDPASCITVQLSRKLSDGEIKQLKKEKALEGVRFLTVDTKVDISRMKYNERRAFRFDLYA